MLFTLFKTAGEHSQLLVQAADSGAYMKQSKAGAAQKSLQKFYVTLCVSLSGCPVWNTFMLQGLAMLKVIF